MSLDSYLMPPDPESEDEVCANCEYTNCVCDLPDDLGREADLDNRN
jgi:hypothetical protein